MTRPSDEQTTRYMHTATVLFDRAPTRSSILSFLKGLGAWSYETPEPGEFGWTAKGPALVTTTEDGIHVMVDVVDRPWPDDLGDGALDSSLVAAWALGEFGDHTLRGALGRSTLHADLMPDPAAVVESHGAFVRIRTSKLGPDGRFLGENAPRSVLLRSMALTTQIGARLIAAPGALAWFVPGGEVLASRSTLQVLDGRADWIERPPIEVWVGVRRNAYPGDHRLDVETVGAPQLGIDEVAFTTELTPATYLTSRVDGYDLVFEALRSGPAHRDGNVVPLHARTGPSRLSTSAG